MGAATGLGLVAGRSTDKLAEQATAVLGSLRGMAAKVGQMASVFEGVLPEHLDAPFSNALARLRDHTETSAYAEIAAVVEAELGASLDTLYQHFDQTPMASASIGQVHHARLHDGRHVAVKVQHPGIERAMQSDLSNARIIERLASNLVPKGFDSDRTFDRVIDRFREELDYRIEADHQMRLARLHQATPGVVIPEVVASHSARRVITTELLQGRAFDEIVHNASTSERQGYATTLWRFVFRSILVGSEFNADPHPGNYLFGAPPTIAFLDFGCVQRLTEPRYLAMRTLHQAAVERDETCFAAAARALLGTRGGIPESFAIGFARKAFTPVFDSPFRIGTDYLRGLVNSVVDAKFDLLRDRRHAMPFPPELALLNRLQFGLYSLLARLDVELDYAAIEREILAERRPTATAEARPSARE